MVKIERRKGESFEAFFRRFMRTVQRSGVQRQARKIRFLTRQKSRGEQRKDAQVRTERREKREYLKRTGKLPEEDQPRYRKAA